MTWPILSLTLLGLVAGPVPGLLRLARLRVPVATTLVVPVALLVLGAAGTLSGRAMTSEAATASGAPPSP